MLLRFKADRADFVCRGDLQRVERVDVQTERAELGGQVFGILRRACNDRHGVDLLRV